MEFLDVPMAGGYDENEGELLPPKCPMLRTIAETVAASYGLTVLDIRSERRTMLLAQARQVAMYLSRHLTRKSLPAIGRYFGNRDHTTVLHGVNKITRLRKSNPNMDAEVAQFMARLGPTSGAA